jgi:D-cysteine desulfhydrase
MEKIHLEDLHEESQEVKTKTGSKVEVPSSLSLCHLPTPIRELTQFHQLLKTRFPTSEIPQLFVKRDDLTDLLLSGNKARKMEFLLAEAKQKGCSVVITCGGVQSNHARTTAVAAAQCGFKCVLVLRTEDGKPPTTSDGNLFIDKMVGAEIRYITAEDYSKRRNEIMQKIAEEKEAKGETCYVIPEGGSNALGCWGYVQFMKELAEQRAEFSHIYVSVGSGATLGGLVLGKWMYDRKEELVGIVVSDSEHFFREQITQFIKDFNATNQCKAQVGNYQMFEYLGPGYSVPYPEQVELTKLLGSTEGILLDPSYSGKAFYGLVDHIKQNKFKKTDKVLFVHTGGLFGLMAQRDVFVK